MEPGEGQDGGRSRLPDPLRTRNLPWTGIDPGLAVFLDEETLQLLEGRVRRTSLGVRFDNLLNLGYLPELTADCSAKYPATELYYGRWVSAIGSR